jgi:hypothetical protein
MPYTVTKLITDAYYKSGIVSKDFETVSGPQFSEGLDSLNDLIADKTVDNGLIPYYTNLTFNLINGTGEYFIENLIDIDTLTFFVDGIRYSTRKNPRKQFFGSPRAMNIESLPFNWHMERCFGGANLFLYFVPDSNYPMEIWGQFRLQPVALNQDLSLTLDRFYIDYLMYQLAERLCDDYSYVVPPGVEKQLAQYIKKIDKKSGPMDLTQRIVSTLDPSFGGVNYGQVNIGKGWTP